MKVILEVVASVDPTKFDEEYAERLRAEYQPTDDVPEPDDEWLAEEAMLSRLSSVQGVEYVTVTETSEGRIQGDVVRHVRVMREAGLAADDIRSDLQWHTQTEAFCPGCRLAFQQ